MREITQGLKQVFGVTAKLSTLAKKGGALALAARGQARWWLESNGDGGWAARLDWEPAQPHWRPRGVVALARWRALLSALSQAVGVALSVEADDEGTLTSLRFPCALSAVFEAAARLDALTDALTALDLGHDLSAALAVIPHPSPPRAASDDAAPPPNADPTADADADADATQTDADASPSADPDPAWAVLPTIGRVRWVAGRAHDAATLPDGALLLVFSADQLGVEEVVRWALARRFGAQVERLAPPAWARHVATLQAVIPTADATLLAVRWPDDSPPNPADLDARAAEVLRLLDGLLPRWRDRGWDDLSAHMINPRPAKTKTTKANTSARASRT